MRKYLRYLGYSKWIIRGPVFTLVGTIAVVVIALILIGDWLDDGSRQLSPAGRGER
jgi:hypothetical protein